ncbi:TrbG/VirB9 family P-type conjugative transfer protein [Paraburkholderia sp. RP-4-7]|uniref:TrbG/VirB9 family P-type conjugative transfer protein n=1 Tax=Paraburkholderia polaris TaxID=2728848 RepID=A0A848ILF5_9BURK|nr:TrbG/VirB9 family P-type conjugative transfer protein [Paraburkholderia polaris]NMM03148.1 TrbG/VirB9 family P-type conjugative transfer protein [Paraburkholderia polaris]
MKRIARYVAIACACLAGTLVHAADTDPFDFDYTIIGANADRPEAVFNDGSQTFIQPRNGQSITADGGHIEGPYVVVDGTPDTIQFRVNDRPATARWKSGNSFIGGPLSPSQFRGDQPAGFAGFSDHLVIIGQVSAIEPVRGISSTMTISSLVKALVPQGWSGSAEKDIDLTNQVAFTTQDGESWMQALDRLMNQGGLFASVDFSKHHVRLERSAPKSVAVAYAPNTAVAGAVAAPNLPAPRTEAKGTSNYQSQLATVFGAQAIRDADDSHVQIRFTSRPTDELTFRNLAGESLHPHWDRDANVVTIDRARVFVVSDGKNKVEIGRQTGMIFDFEANNGAHLEAVFEADGATYFRFAPTVIQASVTDVRGQGKGEQRGAAYKFDGTADQFIATADGGTTTVSRHAATHFYERTPS